MYYQYINSFQVELTTITNDAGGKATKVGKVIFAEDLPEYPETSENGVAYVINITGRTPDEVDFICQNVSYVSYIKNTLLMYYRSNIVTSARFLPNLLICLFLQMQHAREVALNVQV